MSNVCTTPQLLLEDEPSLFGTDCTSVVGDWIFRDPCPAVAATTTPSTPATTTSPTIFRDPSDDDTAAAATTTPSTPAATTRRRDPSDDDTAATATTTPSTPAATTGSPWIDPDRDPRTRNTPKAPLQIQPTEDELAWCRRRLFAGCTPRLHPNAIGLRTPETPRKRCRDDDGDIVLRRSKRLKMRPFRYWLGEGWVYRRHGDSEYRPPAGRCAYRALAGL